MNRYILLTLLIISTFALFVQCKFHKELEWVRVDEIIDDNHTMFFRIYLKHQNLNDLSEKVRDISSPKSPNYSNYLNQDEIMSIIAPDNESRDLIKSWVNSFNPLSLNDDIDVLRISMSKINVERMFNIKLEKFQHLKNRGFTIRSKSDPIINYKYSQYIDLISGISTFPIIKNKKQSFDIENDNIGSAQPKTGLNIINLLGYGETSTIAYTPVCAPSCSGLNNPVSVTITALNTVMNQSVSTLNLLPKSCTSSYGYQICTVTVNSIPYLPTTLSLTDTTTGETVQYPFVFISTPVITPQVIKAYYGVPEGYLITQEGITQCVVEFEEQYMSTNDLDVFFQEMGLPADYNLTFIGVNNLTNPGVEATLDIQYIMAISPGAPTTFWSIYSNSTYTSEGVDDILSWATAAFSMNQNDIPLVNSLSYGIAETYVDQFLGDGYLARSDVEFQKLALLGITIIVSSMDSGAGALGPRPPMATSCDTQLTGGYPSQSHYVTSVGSTYFTPLDQPICFESIQNGGTSCIMQPIGEIGVSIDYGMAWTSGGMFSNTSSLPYYQEELVGAYLNQYSSLLPPSSMFNSSGRAYPDLSTVGHNLYIQYNSNWMTVDGTSASAPIFGGLVTILNDVRAKAGLNPLGFINPLLYQIAKDHPEAFYDVTVGNNRCGEYNLPGPAPTCCPHGFEATPGYDIPSGIGRPNMKVLMEIITQY